MSTERARGVTRKTVIQRLREHKMSWDILVEELLALSNKYEKDALTIAYVDNFLIMIEGIARVVIETRTNRVMKALARWCN